MVPTRVTLLMSLQRGRNAARWDEFHALYHPFLMRYMLGSGLSEADASDVVQEVFVRLLKVLHKFDYDPRKARFRTWLKHVARNSLRDWLRRSRRRREEPCDWQEFETADPRDCEHDFDAQHRASVMQQALDSVRATSRPLTWTCFELHCLNGRSARDVAALTGLTTNGVYINAARTMTRVREKCAEFSVELHDEIGSAVSE